jgi:hypothetical protein
MSSATVSHQMVFRFVLRDADGKEICSVTGADRATVEAIADAINAQAPAVKLDAVGRNLTPEAQAAIREADALRDELARRPLTAEEASRLREACATDAAEHAASLERARVTATSVTLNELTRAAVAAWREDETRTIHQRLRAIARAVAERLGVMVNG